MDIISSEIQRRGLWTPWVRDPNEVGKLPLTRWLYKTLAFAEQSRWEGYLQDRITARGWNSAGFLPRLRALPRSIPQGHRWFLFRYHFNGNMTTTRLAAAGVGSGVEKCIFCGAAEDTCAHLHSCPQLDAARAFVADEARMPTTAWAESVLFLQRKVDGAIFALALAFYAAAWSVRGLRRRQGGNDDIARLIWRTLQCPWLLCFSTNMTRKERRKQRIKPPRPLKGAVRYRSDGASRRRRLWGKGAAGYGAAYWKSEIDSEPHATFRMAIGEETNNVAEYCGLRKCMERAVAAGDRHVVFEVDSDVVAKHMAKRDGYTCGSTDLRPYYEDFWKLGQKLTGKNIAWDVRHIYREYNQTADGLANLAIDDPAGNGPSQRW